MKGSQAKAAEFLAQFGKGPAPVLHRQIAEHNRAYFARYYLGLITPPHQKAWYERLDRRRHLQLAPRDHGKSIIFTRVSPLHRALFIENYRILIVSKAYKISEQFLEVLRADLDRPRIRQDFPRELESFRVKGNKVWVNRTDRSIKEPTIEAIGVGGAITSGHFDLVIMDDIADDLNSKTPSMREFIHTWHTGTISGLIPPEGSEHVVGTRKHPQDEYQRIIDSHAWQVSLDKAVTKYPDNIEYIFEVIDGHRVAVDVRFSGDYEILWNDPGREWAWDMRRLLMRKHEMGPMFEREYQNDASVLEGHLLKTAWLHFYTTREDMVRSDVIMRPIPNLITETVQGWDFAIGEKDRHDFTVCATVERDNLGRVFVKFYRDKIDFPTAVKMVEARFQSEKPRAVGMEANAFQDGYRQSVQARGSVPAVPIKQTRDKVTRILSLAPYFQNGTLYVDIEDGDFFDEFSQFPGSVHDDMLDALEIAMRLLTDRKPRATPTHSRRKRRARKE